MGNKESKNNQHDGNRFRLLKQPNKGPLTVRQRRSGFVTNFRGKFMSS
jgi:hypothetical protein